MSEPTIGGMAALIAPITTSKFRTVERLQMVKKKGKPPEQVLVKEDTNICVAANERVRVLNFWDGMAIVEFKGERFATRLENLTWL